MGQKQKRIRQNSDRTRQNKTQPRLLLLHDKQTHPPLHPVHKTPKLAGHISSITTSTHHKIYASCLIVNNINKLSIKICTCHARPNVYKQTTSTNTKLKYSFTRSTQTPDCHSHKQTQIKRQNLNLYVITSKTV